MHQQRLFKQKKSNHLYSIGKDNKQNKQYNNTGPPVVKYNQSLNHRSKFESPLPKDKLKDSKVTQEKSTQQRRSPDNSLDATSALTFEKGRNITVNTQYQLKIRQRKQLTPLQRIIVIDWLRQIVYQLKLMKEVLHRSIYYLDQLSSKMEIKKEQCQVYALCCLVISQKLQSQHHITPQEAVELINNHVPQKDFIQLEQRLLLILKFKLNPFTIYCEIKLLTKGIEIYFKGKLNLQHVRQRLLWIVEGVAMQRRYFQQKLPQRDVCLALLYLQLHKENLITLPQFQHFCRRIFDQSLNSIISLELSMKYAAKWVQQTCKCQQIYSNLDYHPQLKQIAASFYQ